MDRRQFLLGTSALMVSCGFNLPNECEYDGNTETTNIKAPEGYIKQIKKHYKRLTEFTGNNPGHDIIFYDPSQCVLELPSGVDIQNSAGFTNGGTIYLRLHHPEMFYWKSRFFLPYLAYFFHSPEPSMANTLAHEFAHDLLRDHDDVDFFADVFQAFYRSELDLEENIFFTDFLMPALEAGEIDSSQVRGIVSLPLRLYITRYKSMYQERIKDFINSGVIKSEFESRLEYKVLSDKLASNYETQQRNALDQL